MSTQIEEGDKVSWNWNGSHPSGTASEVKPGEVTVTSHRGNDISKTGDESNPAVHISRPGNDVVKTANELKVESKGEPNGDSTEESNDDGNDDGSPAPQEEKKDPEEANTGDKRTVDEESSADAEEKTDDANDAKKQKTSTDAKTNGTNGEKKKAGRPKNSNGPKKEKKAPTVGRAQRQTRSQGAPSTDKA
ncbi:hypothetical protein LOCC1_G003455 [Lachnellula occidentalis]|uniref:Hypervirulence associated protein TUDOR domain-containing protein n=1 Tax=Lachnellula occidentalis TaxID=215460 RepID=A0A8H8UIV6_9HELO|nr:hypothetical protein LOCC1_G003455 [Lachnellula occidentalis]